MAEFKQDAGPNSEQYASEGNMDIKKGIHFHYEKPADEKYIQYLKLVEEFEEEIENGDSNIGDFIDKLLQYTKRTYDNNLDLKEKLRLGGYSDSYYRRANAMKEKYAMNFLQEELSISAQKIHAYILAEVSYRFSIHINLFIEEGYSRVEIAELINVKVVEPIEAILAQKNVLNIGITTLDRTLS
ncbi:hypothetical protein INR75_19640 [Zunongwangia sp. SCSIO 43204]|uniref:ABC-three component system protein n=1 Tax=Zunongwangia sp. SCSIO 43204 TaxID=2779359 RepID=UPI001CA9A2C1|nr:ABC-three component system protein [Zunongwangia sp. SCSIO 43204]UAB84338.1 hypothetical protein INR75_19640 [Zunongwangia sp. SCSIO 43204]